MRIAIPKKLTALAVSAVLLSLRNRESEKSLEIDFSSIDFVYPFGSIALLTGMQGLIKNRKTAGLETVWNVDVINSNGCSYLQRFGFFDHLGVQALASLKPLQVGNSRFLLIERINRDYFEFEGIPVQQKLDHFCMQLAKILLQTTEEHAPQVSAIAWSLREIVRNVFEHADTADAYVTAQSWTNGTVELAIGDCGIGIEAGLSKAFELTDGVHALRMAILPGITEYQGPETRDKWQNSGFGLYMLSEISKEFGSFVIGSSQAMLSVDKRGASVARAGFWTGTTVGITLKIPPDTYWENLLERTKLLGEEKAKSITGARAHASVSSGSPWRGQ